MSMSTWVTGFRPPDAKWEQMKTIWDACEAAGVSIPRDVDDFFDGARPDPRGIVVSIKDAVTKWGDPSSEGLAVEISKLPKSVTHIRFVNSW